MDLPNPLELILHRVFHCNDVLLLGVYPVQRSIKGSRLTAPCRTGNKDYAVCPGQELFDIFRVFFIEAHFIEANQSLHPVEQSQDRSFPKEGGHNRYPDIDIPCTDEESDASVLGKALFCNIEICHYLHPADKSILDDFRRTQDPVEDAVYPHPHLKLLLIGFYMDIAGLFLYRLEEKGVEKPYDRSLFGKFQEV